MPQPDIVNNSRPLANTIAAARFTIVVLKALTKVFIRVALGELTLIDDSLGLRDLRPGGM